MIRDAGSAGSANQCEVVSIALGGGSSGNRLRCSFDASASTPQGGITSYIWRFGTGIPGTPGAGSMAFTRTTPTISGSEFTLPCGSFGATPPIGSVFDRNVTLEIDTPGGKNEISLSITFLRNGPCG